MAAERSRAKTHADHWDYLFVRGALASRLTNENTALRTLIAKWRELLIDGLIVAFGAEDMTEEAIHRITSTGPEKAYQNLVRAFAEVAPVGISDALAFVRELRLPCACIAVDIWKCAFMLLSIKVGFVQAPLHLSVGGSRVRLPDQPFVFVPIPGEAPEHEHRRLIREWAEYHMTPVALLGFKKKPTEKHQEKLRRWCDWYFRRRVQGHSERSLAGEYKVSRPAITYGVKEIERLLSLSLARLKLDGTTSPLQEK